MAADDESPRKAAVAEGDGHGDAAARRVAERAVLHGSIDGLTPAETLLVVLPAAGLTSTRDGERLIIRATAG